VKPETRKQSLPRDGYSPLLLKSLEKRGGKARLNEGRAFRGQGRPFRVFVKKEPGYGIPRVLHSGEKEKSGDGELE